MSLFKSFLRFPLLHILGMLMLPLAPGFAQPTPFPVLPLSQDTSSIDLSFLNPTPAGQAGFISVSGPDFLDGAGKPLKFWGINTTGEAGLPAKDLAPVLARWLASQGFNLVRLHFLDQNWGPGGILSYPDKLDGPPEKLLDPQALDRLDYFQAELKKQGIYVNLNLHVGRTYPGSQISALGDFSKGLDAFYPPYIQALKTFSREILSHKNPYTGLEWRQDPALALVEVNNENSLLDYKDDLAARLSGPHRETLENLWSQWLTKKYPTKESYQKAVQDSPGSPGPSGPQDPKFSGWTLENHQGAQGQWTHPGGPVSTLKITAPGTKAWHLQISQKGYSWSKGTYFRFTFQARSAQNLGLEGSLANAQAPWDSAGVWGSWSLTPEWKTYTLEGRVSVSQAQGRIILSAGTRPGDIQLKEPRWEILPEEVPGYGTGTLPVPRSPWVYHQEFKEFLEDLDYSYAQDLHRFLKQEVKVRCPVAHTQVNYGGPAGLRRERNISDWIDIHAYHDHPTFPGKAWDSKNWNILNSPLAPDGGPLAKAARWQRPDRPFVLSEWNIPAPNEYRMATVPAAALMGSLKNWAGICLYTLSDFDSTYASEGQKGFFTIYTDPTKTHLMPWGALVFRQQRWKPAESGEQNTITGPSSGQGIWWAWGSLGRVYETPLGTLEITGWSEPGFPWGGLFLASLDGKPLETSQRVLFLSLSKAQKSKTTSLKDWGTGPEGITGPRGIFRLKQSDWTVKILDRSNRPLKILKGQTLDLPIRWGALSWLMERTVP